jgi:hypothetical protein
VALSIFDDKSHKPEEDEVKAALGKAYAAWTKLQKIISARFAPVTIEWGNSGKATGWGVRIKTDKRAILYMTPCNGYFLASFALGEKAVRAAHESDLPASILNVIDSAKKYAEGRGVRIEVRTVAELPAIEKLAIIKMEH